MYIDAITGRHSDVAELVAMVDVNPGRLAYYDGAIGDRGVHPTPGTDGPVAA